MSRATTLVSVAQQLALSTGVAVGALVVELMLQLKHGSAMNAYDFPPAFLAVGVLTAARGLDLCPARARCRRRTRRTRSDRSGCADTAR